MENGQTVGRNEYHGADPYMILKKAIKDRPVPAIERPLGSRSEKTNQEPVVIINKLGALADWNEQMRGREWTG